MLDMYSSIFFRLKLDPFTGDSRHTVEQPTISSCVGPSVASCQETVQGGAWEVKITHDFLANITEKVGKCGMYRV